MRQYLLDTNVLIDYLTLREPFGATAAALLRAGAVGKVRFYAASLSFVTIEYIIRRQTSTAQARQLPEQLAHVVEIVPVGAVTVRQALASDFTDFEDAIQYFTALTQPTIQAIITRDPKGFRASSLPVLSVAGALLELDNAA